MITILTQSKYQDIFDGFVESVREWVPEACAKVVVGNVQAAMDWVVMPDPQPWNCNVALNQVFAKTKGDVLYMTDDCRFCDLWTVRRLEEELAADPELGAVGPLVKGEMGDGRQMFSETAPPMRYVNYFCLNAVLIRREAWPLDLPEGYKGYGWDDIDFTLRIKRAGWRMGITNKTVVEHLHAGTTWERATDKMPNGLAYNQRLFGEMWRGKLDFLGKIEVECPIDVVLKQLQEAR